jgi:DNA-binding transcriptional LysR family regulator
MEQYDLTDLRAFITVVESGSFVRAAEQLDVSTAAISRRIATLEAALGTQLITRTTRRNDITDAGRAFYADAQAVFQLLDEAHDRVRQGQDSASGTLRVAAPLSFGIQKVAPVLPPFMKRHPGLKVHLLLEDRTTDLHCASVSCAIPRWWRPALAPWAVYSPRRPPTCVAPASRRRWPHCAATRC